MNNLVITENIKKYLNDKNVYFRSDLNINEVIRVDESIKIGSHSTFFCIINQNKFQALDLIP
ncbi:hypothetical protein H9L19_08020 [Weissella diestrammenae]|uniref:Uncharacterized protein n=1 Tax=Weissella diestrammenae TaxID=1162633 RepID=A0A7G9T5C1_9LACO|nr:hypothetical protein [Weissella diestrammenae]MCM0583154.1 hypothetical protein [Weissella diestrammenae]QNN75296.1 hypothetical protein H9L19_08020 [Weissella diestrammenae]